MTAEVFEKEVLKKITEKAKGVIKDALNNEQRLQSWTSLQTVRGMSNGKYDWIIALVNAVFTSFQMFQNYEKIVGTLPFEQNTMIALRKLRESSNDILFDLFITGIDEETTKNLQSVSLGGELKLPDSDQLRIIDKNTAINEKDIEEAAIKLQYYFERTFEAEALRLVKDSDKKKKA